MKQKVVICAGTNSYEFEGEITEFTESHIVLKATRGEFYIERKYLVFIQFLSDEVEEEKIEATRRPIEKRTPSRHDKIDKTVRFINKQLKRDPLEEKIWQKLVPPSQLPDDEEHSKPPWPYVDEDDEELVEPSQPDEDDEEVMRNIFGGVHPTVKASNLQQAAQMLMKNEDQDFSMGMGNMDYKTPTQTVLSLLNGKKTRSR